MAVVVDNAIVWYRGGGRFSYLVRKGRNYSGLNTHLTRLEPLLVVVAAMGCCC